MKKLYISLLFCYLFITNLTAQVFEIDQVNGQNIPVCNATFYDSGGQFGNYGTNENFTVTFCSTVPSQGLIVSFNSVNIGFGDQLCAYNGSNTSAPVLTCLNNTTTGSGIAVGSSNANGCITFNFTSDGNNGTVGAGWDATFSCQVNCQPVIADVLSSSPVMFPADTGYIDICEGDAVTLTGTGLYPQNNTNYTQSDATSTFEWIIEGQTFTGQTVTHVFNNAGGYRVQLKVTDVNGCESTNSVDQRVRVAPPPIFSGTNSPSTTACLGDTIDLFGNYTAQSESFAAALARGDSLFLPDGNGVCYQTTLEFTDFNPNQTITNINDLVGICVNMEHSWVGDLDISITCPNGNQVVLVPNPNFAGGLNLGIPVNFGGGAGQGFDYCWTPTATTTMSQANGAGLTVSTSAGPSIAPGNYASSQSLAGLIGCPLNGQWELEICDNIPADNGYIFSWGIELDQSLYPQLDTFTPAFTNSQWIVDTGIVVSDTVSYVLQSTGTSNFTYSITNEFGCTYDTTIVINVIDPPQKPILTCASSNASSITISRSSVTGAGSYEINVNNAGWQTFTGINFTVSNLSPLESVFFQLRAIGGNSCNTPSEVDTITCITADCQLVASLDSLTQVTCNGANDGIAYFSATSNLGPFTYSLDNGTGQASGTFMNVSVGNHFVIVEDGNTCLDTINFTITESDPLSSTNSMTEVLCNGESDGTATVAGLGGILPYSYAWDANANNQITATATNLAAGTYTVTITDGNNCFTIDQVTVTEPTVVGVTMSKIDVACFQESSGSAIATPNGGVGGYTYQWNTAPVQTTDTATNLPIGTYSVTVSDANSCTVSDNITLTEPNLLVISADTNRVTCFGTADGEGIATTLGGTSPYNYLWSTNDTTSIADTLSGGFYTVTVTDAQGCQDSITVGIYEPPKIINTFTTTQVTCFGLSDGTATVTSSGGIGNNYTYEWNNPANNQTTPTAINLPGGFFGVTVRDEENCPQFDTINVFAPPLVFVDTITSTPTLCYESNEGTVFTSGFGGSGTLSFVWSNGSPDSSQTNLFAGQYTVTISDNFGCIAIDSVIVDRPDSIEISFTPTQLLCNGDGTGAVSTGVIGGTSSYNYLWSLNANTTTSLSNLQSGTYSLTITDQQNCVQVDSVFVSEPMPLTATATYVEPLCFGDANGSATIFPSGGNGGYTFSWNTSPIQNDTTATGLTIGNYTYSVTDSNNCFYQNNITVTQPDALVINMNTQSITCRDSADGIAIATPIGGSYPFSYDWSTSTLNDSILPALDTGNYSVTITDVFGCIASNNISVTQPDYITTNLIKSDLSCYESGDGNALITVNGGVGTYTFLWSNGSMTNSAVGLDSGWVSILITDSNNCPKQDSALISQPPEILVSTSSTLTNCFGDNTGTATAMATGGVGSFVYTWNTTPTQIVGTATNLFAGNYLVTATDATGCTAIDSVTVGQPTELIISLSKTDMSCFGQPDGSATVTGTGGTVANDYTYLWSTNSNNATINNLTNIIYSVSVTDDNGCTTIDSIEIIEPPILASTIAQVPASCFQNNDATATINVNGGTADTSGNYLYQWSTLPVQTTATATQLFGGLTYFVTVTDANNCIHTDTVTINHPNPLTLTDTTTETTCDYTADGTGTILPSGGTMPYFYEWSDSQTTATGINLNKGFYTTTVTDNNGCQAVITVNINGPDPILLEATSVAALCKGDANGSLLASAQGGTPIGGDFYTFLWSDGQADSLAANLLAGTYTVTATDAVGCIGVDSFNVNEPILPLTPNMTGTDITCFGDGNGIVRINPFGGTPPYRFSPDNQSYSSANNISGLDKGTYIYYVKDANNCVSADTVEIQEPLLFSVYLPSDTIIPFPDEVTVLPQLQNGIPPFSYLWEAQDSIIDCQDCPELITNVEGLRYLTVTDSSGCIATATVFIEVEKSFITYIATGFTPNDDGVNDWLFVQGDDNLVSIKSFDVYDRWGEHVFEAKDIAPNVPDLGWNGTFRGQRAQSGVYAWIIEVEYADGTTKVLKGNTVLLW